MGKKMRKHGFLKDDEVGKGESGCKIREVGGKVGDRGNRDYEQDMTQEGPPFSFGRAMAGEDEEREKREGSPFGGEGETGKQGGEETVISQDKVEAGRHQEDEEGITGSDPGLGEA